MTSNGMCFHSVVDGGHVDKCQSLLKMKYERCNLRLLLVVREKTLNIVVDVRDQCTQKYNFAMSKMTKSPSLVEESSA